MSEGEGWISVIQGYCRMTDLGAETSFYIVSVQSGHAKIRSFNVSKSGNHWQEEVLVTKDFKGTIGMKDISNTGKHWCRLFHVQDGKIVGVIDPPEDYWHIKCPVCEEIRKSGMRKRV